MEPALTILAMLHVLGLQAEAPRTTETPVTDFEAFARESWKTDGRQLVRDRILTATGLLPMPPKRLLHPRFGPAVAMDGIRIEPVVLETVPGFQLGGNLYRPLRSEPHSRPAVLTPHGHWQRGRLHHDERGSIPARCVSLARQGYVVFAYDMVGYNDTGVAISHGFAQGDRRAMLWGVSLGGLQTWNSIRAMDFVLGLPEVDPERIGVTGASGGGTQTFLLCAIDDRWAACAPVNMISAHFQGGCLCENPPELRIGGDAHNLAIAAVAAPKPMLMVSCTGDWTKNTPTVEGPALRRAWDLYGAGERLQWVQFDYEHNYNQDSREAVYAFFGQYLLGDDDPEHFREAPFDVPSDEQLLYFKDRQAPPGALDEAGLIDALISERRAQYEALRPRDAASLAAFREAYGRAFAQLFTWSTFEPEDSYSRPDAEGWLTIGGGEVRARWHEGDVAALGTTVVVGTPPRDDAVAALTRSGQRVLELPPFVFDPPRDELAAYYTTYNPTALQEHVRQVQVAAGFAASGDRGPVTVVGLGPGAAAVLCAAPRLRPSVRLVVDLSGLDATSDETFTGDLWTPGLLRAGGLEAAAILAGPRELVIAGAPWLDEAAVRLGHDLTTPAGPLSPEALAELCRRAP